ncbi:hypothetical protein [Lactococcus lactis]
MLFIGMLALSIIIFLQGKSFVPTACYFLIMAAILEVMIVEIDQYKLKEMEIQNLKKSLYSLDSKLYLSLIHENSSKEEPEVFDDTAQSKEWIEKEDVESNFERVKKEEFVEMQENKQKNMILKTRLKK